MSVSERLSDAGYGAGWRLVKLLPESAARRGFDVGANLAARRGAGQGQLRSNLARVLGVARAEVPDELIQRSIRSYARYWREAFRLPSLDLAATGAQLDADIEGREHIRAAVESGRGAVLALPHSGNWDMAGVWLVWAFGEFSTVAERLKPESLFQRFVEYRKSLGFDVYPLSGGEEPPFGALRKRLESGGVVCLLGERDLTGKGVPVEFFGERTSMPAGPAKLAIETGAALLPVHCWFTESGWGFSVGEEIDTSGGVGPSTQLLADVFATNIAAHPADWHMLAPLWWSDLSDSRRARLEEG